ncbi:Receptor-like protein 12 [Dichanthelium oligosanthes]|uniref:Receptor-like protein 12 n=1 Tax=Dichanthelium oligosanthes TaxID=888268 RepID=A0A1E5VEB2_9POAL|nr:Receptor-like protein 12 [Dichanthelium oligosanthes]
MYLSSWSSAAAISTTSPCNWEFITCNSAGDVTGLGISSASLNGTLAELDFSAFVQLETLTLVQNDLYCAIPEAIGNLTSLVSLVIQHNPRLHGPIPRSVGHMKQLASLRLQALGLDGAIPDEIGNLTSLKELYLDDNNLTGSVPPTVGKLVKLTSLDLSNNDLAGTIPVVIGNMTELQILNLADNNLQGELPGTLAQLRKLSALFVTNNQLGGDITPCLRNKSSLIEVNVAGNNFSKISAKAICAGGSLLHFVANDNWFADLHDLNFQNCTSLRFLDLAANGILAGTEERIGPLPLTLRNLSKLFSLDLSNCSLTGQAHDLLITDQSILSFPNIEILALSSNYIMGTMPTLLCNANFLKILDLSNNALHGDLPNCLWDLPSLQLVDLSSNYFSGIVPSSMSSSITLQSLHLANNHFEGNFPSIIKNRYKLITLDLGGNSFTGEIPSWIAESLPQLRFLRLSSNMFSGFIPQNIFQFTQLQLLDLSHNKLIGPIPVDFANFTGMTQEQEQEHGEIIYFFVYCEKLQLVWKNENYVYRRMITFIMGIDLSSNLLSQTIPEGLTTLPGLRYLNLSRNHLSGDIPKDIGNLALLESLDLSWNQLEGEIPPSFADLKSISTLNLSNNGLSGMIPTGSQLQTLVDPSIYGNNPGLSGFPLKDVHMHLDEMTQARMMTE